MYCEIKYTLILNWTAKETCHFCQRPHVKIQPTLAFGHVISKGYCNIPVFKNCLFLCCEFLCVTFKEVASFFCCPVYIQDNVDLRVRKLCMHKPSYFRSDLCGC